MRKTLLATLLSLLVLPSSVAQGPSFSILVGPAVPQGDLAEKDLDRDDSGYARLGIGVMAEVMVPLGNSGLNVVGSVSGIANPLDTRAIEKDTEPLFQGQVDVDGSYWINVPVMGGLAYIVPVSPGTQLIFSAQTGLNLLRPATLELRATSSDGRTVATVSEDRNSSTSLGFRPGFGLRFANRFRVDIAYISLGTPEISVEQFSEITQVFEGKTIVFNESEDFDYDQPVSFIQFSIGITL